MSTDIIMTLEQQLPNMTKSQKRVINFIIDNPVRAAMATINQLSTESGVSTATIVRTTIALGYGSYSDFQRKLQSHLMLYAVPLRRIESLSEGNDSEKAYAVNTILQQQIDNLVQTSSHITEQQVDDSVKILKKASHIYIIAERNCRVTAYYLYHNLNRITDRVDLLTYYDFNLPEHLHRIKPGDAVISICMPRYAARIVNATRIAKERGASVISITDAATSPLAEYSDCLFSVRQQSYGLHNSQMSSLLIAEILIIRICWEDVETAKNNLSEVEEIFQSLRLKPAHALVSR
ncbi:MurR/RpiR family transcriptional regulator [Oscillospiraceae bacterium LTW-04]|nr:MurR/RpiR family transcriptional regulator [Oscillospiraceae bacterium MB24-C1]